MRGLICRWLVGATLSVVLAACATTSNPALPNESKAVASDPLSRARVHTELAALYYQQGSMKTALDELATAARSMRNTRRLTACWASFTCSWVSQRKLKVISRALLH